jgi:uncharacterized membrane protein YagU involved in acid resistance
VVPIGIVGGLIAGLFFIIGEVALAVALGRSPLAPLRMIAGIVLGPAALDRTRVDFGTAAGVGLLIHFILSPLYGVIFSALVDAIAALRQAGIVRTGLVFGLSLWLVNFYVISLPFGWGWFAKMNPFAQFILHSVVFGGSLGGSMVGWYMAGRPR